MEQRIVGTLTSSSLLGLTVHYQHLCLHAERNHRADGRRSAPLSSLRRLHVLLTSALMGLRACKPCIPAGEESGGCPDRCCDLCCQMCVGLCSGLCSGHCSYTFCSLCLGLASRCVSIFSQQQAGLSDLHCKSLSRTAAVLLAHVQLTLT